LVRSGDAIAGRYRLENVVGAGGMGEVWRATDLELRRVVAVKQASTGDDEGIRREARIGAGLHHPHVVSVFDVVVEDGVRWLVMEYMPARSLAEVVRSDGPLPARRVAHVGRQVAAALSAMHGMGMVHRDVTLGNVLLADDGTAKLADLGVAVWSEVTVTGTAQNAGTPGYVAPEVLRGHPATAAADVFSLGMTLSVASEGLVADGPLASVLSALVDPSPGRRPSAERVVQLLAAVAAGEEGQAGSGDAAATVPRQLPSPTRDFVGRAAELAALTTFAEGAAGPLAISTVAGGGGVGKTALAVHWAHQVADRFPDGQLYLNLRGFDPSGAPMPPGEAIRNLLDAFGVPAEQLPTSLDAQAGLYRSLIAGRRMLVLLDNARDSDQVRPLLPGTSGCLVLVTSRNRLTGLITGHGARHLPIDVLPDPQARSLLSARLGADRIAGEPAATDEILAYCGGVPLALSIVAGRVQTEPHLSLASVAEDLREARLGALADDDPAVSLPTVFSWSYAALTAEQTRVLGLLAIAPGPDIGLRAAANLAGLPGTRARALLRGLAQVSLIDQDAAGRYRMHDLVRHHAADRAATDQTPADREAALRRLAAFFLHTAYAGNQILPPPRQPFELDLPTPEEPHPLADEAAVVAWFEAEHSGILATQQLAAARGWHHVVWQLAGTLENFHDRREHRHDNATVWQAGLAAAVQLDDPTIRARAYRGFGRALSRADRLPEALDHLRQAVTLTEEVGDVQGQADVHRQIGSILSRRGEHERALEHCEQALHLYRRLNIPAWESAGLNAVGYCHAQLGDYHQARTYCETALAQLAGHRDPEAEAGTLDSLGYITSHLGEHDQAVDYYERAVERLESIGNTYNKADILEGLGHPLVALGRHEQARETWQEAVALFRAHHRTADAERVQQLLLTVDTA
jgi:Tfp pilus assembly protein PilF